PLRAEGADVLLGEGAEDSGVHGEASLYHRAQPVIRRVAGENGGLGGACSARWAARTIHVLTETPSAAAASSIRVLRLSGRRSETRAWEYSDGPGGSGGVGGDGGVGSVRGRRSTTTSGWPPRRRTSTASPSSLSVMSSVSSEANSSRVRRSAGTSAAASRAAASWTSSPAVRAA